MHSKISSLAIAMLVFLAANHQADAYMPRLEANRLCRVRTGLTDRDLAEYKTRNEDCTIECIMKQGTLMTAFADDGTSCHDNEGYRCVLGRCRSPDDKSDDEIKSGELNQVYVSVKSAYVADRDPYPGQGESDAFVLVEVVSDAQPLLADGDVLCHTHVVQDNSRPRWNFTCKPQPMKASAKLRFVVMDSDKPDLNPQLLGTATQSLETLMNAGPQTLTLDSGSLAGGPYTLDVEVKGKKYAFE